MIFFVFVFFFLRTKLLLSAVEGKEQGVQGNLCVNSPEVESSVEEDYEALWPFRWLPEFWQALWPTVLPDRNFHSALRGNARRLEGEKKFQVENKRLFLVFMFFCLLLLQEQGKQLWDTHTHTVCGTRTFCTVAVGVSHP